MKVPRYARLPELERGHLVADKLQKLRTDMKF